MTGIALIRKFRAIEEQANRLGFQITASKYFNRDHDVVALQPLDGDSLPIYSRDAELFVGSIEELEGWLRGLEWARQYDRLLFGKNHGGKRARLEQQVRNKQLVKVLSD